MGPRTNSHIGMEARLLTPPCCCHLINLVASVFEGSPFAGPPIQVPKWVRIPACLADCNRERSRFAGLQDQGWWESVGNVGEFLVFLDTNVN